MLCRCICTYDYTHKCLQRLEVNLEYQSLRALPPLFAKAGSSVGLELATRASPTGHCASDLLVCVTCHRDYRHALSHLAVLTQSAVLQLEFSRLQSKDFRNRALFLAQGLFLYSF